MHIVKVENLNPGDVLGKSLYNERGELLLASGFRLNGEMIGALTRHGFHHVFIMDDLSPEVMPEEVIRESVRQIVNQNLAATFEGVKNNLAFETFAPDEIKKRINSNEGLRNAFSMPNLRAQVSTLIDEIVENQITMFTALPTKSQSGKQYQHSIDTTLLAILLGQYFRLSYRELRILGLGAMVHDVGKMAFGNLVEKPEKEWTRDERMIMREHPVYSMLILRGSQPSSYVEQSVVMQHHEKYDGTGYPQGLKSCGLPPGSVANIQGKNLYIHRFAEILAVANAFDNLVAGESDGVRKTPEDAVAAIISEAGLSFNPHVVRALGKVVQLYPVGAQVRLKSSTSGAYVGYIGVVVKSNPVEPSRPTIVLIMNAVGAKIAPRVMGLEGEKHVQLELLF